MSVLEDAFEDAWRRVEASKAPYAGDEYAPAGRTIIAKYIIGRATAGERDARYLADAALVYLTKQKLRRTPPTGLITGLLSFFWLASAAC